MSPMRPQVTVLSGGAAAAAPPRSQLETAYQSRNVRSLVPPCRPCRDGRTLHVAVKMAEDAIANQHVPLVRRQAGR